jgi:molecular chaperone GrpE
MSSDKKKESESKKIEELQQKIDELTDALQRERADSTNLRRRADEERGKLGNIYKSVVLREFLPVLDNLERALKHTPKDLKDHDYVKGIQGVAKQFDKALELLDVKRIKTNGEKFDPKFHEAVSVEESDGNTEVVAEELQSGYTLGNEVIRHAMVKVRMEDKK